MECADQNAFVMRRNLRMKHQAAIRPGPSNRYETLQRSQQPSKRNLLLLEPYRSLELWRADVLEKVRKRELGL